MAMKNTIIRRAQLLLVTANAVPSSLILVTLIMEALSSSEKSVFTRETRHNLLEDGILNIVNTSLKHALLRM
jgi:hypothetical protein